MGSGQQTRVGEQEVNACSSWSPFVVGASAGTDPLQMPMRLLRRYLERSRSAPLEYTDNG